LKPLKRELPFAAELPGREANPREPPPDPR
jgi:hypothetical protein